MLYEEFRKWLILLLESEQYGGNETKLAEDIGMQQPWVNKLKAGELQGKIGLDTLDTIAKSLGYPAWQVVWSFETGNPLPPRPPFPPDPS